MAGSIEHDSARYRDIVKGRVRKELKKYISHSEMLGRKGKNLVSIPIPRIEIPHFRFDPGGAEGVGQGEGDVGDVLGRSRAGPGSGSGAGDQPGAHIMEVELTLDELAADCWASCWNYRTSSRAARTTSSATRTATPASGARDPRACVTSSAPTSTPSSARSISGTYDPRNPRIMPIREDKYYRSWTSQPGATGQRRASST